MSSTVETINNKYYELFENIKNNAKIAFLKDNAKEYFDLKTLNILNDKVLYVVENKNDFILNVYVWVKYGGDIKILEKYIIPSLYLKFKN